MVAAEAPGDADELSIVISMNAAEFAASALAPSTPVPLPPPDPGVLVPGMRQPVIVVVLAVLLPCVPSVLCPAWVWAAAVAPAATATSAAKK